MGPLVVVAISRRSALAAALVLLGALTTLATRPASGAEPLVEVFSNPAVGAHELVWPTDEQRDFLSVVGLALGEYDLINGPPGCEQGELRFATVPDSVALLLGPHPLIWGIGEERVASQERECDFETASTYGSGVAAMVHTSRCADGLENRIELTVTATDVGFDYELTWSGGEERCSLRLVEEHVVSGKDASR